MKDAFGQYWCPLAAAAGAPDRGRGGVLQVFFLSGLIL
jgi:hypothetical protein